MTRRLVVSAAVGLLAALLAACGTGASPAASAAAATAAATPSTATSSAAPLSSAAATASPTPPGSTSGVPVSTPSPTPTPAPTFALTSSAFDEGGAIPSRYTCDGHDVSPALAWSGVPTGAQSLVLLVDDPDANSFAHWIVYAVAPDAAGMAEGAGAKTASLAQGTNDFGRVGYGGPCPPSGTHHYRFTLYAVAAPLGLSGAPRAGAVRAALARAAVLGKATLTATYRRGG